MFPTFPLELTAERAAVLARLLKDYDAGLTGGGSTPTASARRLGVKAYIVELSEELPGIEGDTPGKAVAKVWKFDGEDLVEAGHDVDVYNVLPDALPEGRYAAFRDPYSGKFVVAGGGGAGYEGPLYSSGISGGVGAGSVGPVDSDVWGQVQARNVVNYNCPSGTPVTLRRDDADPDPVYSILWYNLCSIHPDDLEG